MTVASDGVPIREGNSKARVHDVPVSCFFDRGRGASNGERLLETLMIPLTLSVAAYESLE